MGNASFHIQKQRLLTLNALLEDVKRFYFIYLLYSILYVCLMFLKHHEIFLHIGCLIERVEEVTSGPSVQLICGILGSFVIMMGCLYNIIHSSGSSTAIQKPDIPSRNNMYFCK